MTCIRFKWSRLGDLRCLSSSRLHWRNSWRISKAIALGTWFHTRFCWTPCGHPWVISGIQLLRRKLFFCTVVPPPSCQLVSKAHNYGYIPVISPINPNQGRLNLPAPSPAPPAGRSGTVSSWSCIAGTGSRAESRDRPQGPRRCGNWRGPNALGRSTSSRPFRIKWIWASWFPCTGWKNVCWRNSIHVEVPA